MNARIESLRIRYGGWRLIALGGGLLVYLALFVFGPLSMPVSETPIYLRTASADDLQLDGGGCFAANTTGLLIPDAGAGTAIVEQDMGGGTVPVIWPPGYTGRRTDSGQVEVVDQKGNVVASTGTRIELLGGFDDGDTGPTGWLACYDGVYPPLPPK